MTQPPPPPVDPGNQLLAESPGQLTCSLVQTPAGQRLTFTIRTPTTTLTLLLSKDDAIAWAGHIRQAAKTMSGSGLIVANGHQVPPPKGQP